MKISVFNENSISSSKKHKNTKKKLKNRIKTGFFAICMPFSIFGGSEKLQIWEFRNSSGGQNPP
jgi:Txe/YoeB family toxin of Txe-Axe toxin-antitoxin module